MDLRSIIPPPRQAVPFSLQDRIARRWNDDGLAARERGSVCGVNTMCASFPEEMPDVSAWIGFPYSDDDADYFIATYGQEAVHLGGGEYATAIWDRRHFFIQIGDSVVPFVIQPRFVMEDAITGNAFYAIDYLGYRLPGVDYTDYPLGFSVSSLIAEVDTEGFVADLYIEYYDENDQFVDNYDIESGDELGSFLLGFNAADPGFVTLFFIEELAFVTEEPEFFFEEWYPGITFPCTLCDDLDLSQVQFHYSFESFGEARSTFTDPILAIGGDSLLFIDGFENGDASRWSSSARGSNGLRAPNTTVAASQRRPWSNFPWPAGTALGALFAVGVILPRQRQQ